MLLRYNYEGLPQLEEIKRCRYDIHPEEAVFFSEDAIVRVRGIDAARWGRLMNDMFADDKLVIPDNLPVMRNPV